MLTFSDYLKQEADFEGEIGKLAKYILSRADVKMFVSDEAAYAASTNETRGSYPIWSQEPLTHLRYMTAHAPQYIEIWHNLSENYREASRNRNWPDLRAPVKPKKRDVDYEKLTRQAGRKKYLTRNNRGTLVERDLDGKETD